MSVIRRFGVIQHPPLCINALSSKKKLIPYSLSPCASSKAAAALAAAARCRAETSSANYFGTVWRREISLPRAHIIIISAAIYIFYSVINARVVSLSGTGFRKWPSFINLFRGRFGEGVLATVLSEFFFDLLYQGVAIITWHVIFISANKMSYILGSASDEISTRKSTSLLKITYIWMQPHYDRFASDKNGCIITRTI